jgi:hypothetical protein
MEANMTAPDTNVTHQTKRHAPSLTAIVAAVVVGVGLIGYWAFSSAGDTSPPPSPAATEAPAGIEPSASATPGDPAAQPSGANTEPDLAPPTAEPAQ